MRIKKILAGITVGLLLTGAVMADDTNVTVDNIAMGNSAAKKVTWFSTYDVGGSTGSLYDYNDQQGAGDQDGEVNCLKYNNAKTIMVDVITLGSTSIDVRVEGRLVGSGEWGEIVTKKLYRNNRGKQQFCYSCG